MVTLYSAGFILFRIENGQRLYLLLHYPHGHWDFAKGKIEKGETKAQAALRELREETGLTATIIEGFEESFDYFFKQEGQLIKKSVSYFIGKSERAEVTLSFEHKNYAWLSYDQAIERLSYDNAKKVLQSAEQFLSEKK